jgi:hypothetical protein
MIKIKAINNYGIFEAMINKKNYSINDIIKVVGLIEDDVIEVYRNDTLLEKIEVLQTDIIKLYTEKKGYHYYWNKLLRNGKPVYIRKSEKKASSYINVTKKELLQWIKGV